MKKIEKALLPGEKAFFPSENAHVLVESPLFFEGHKPLPWENQSNLCTGNGSLDKPHSNSLALSNGRMILNSESATKFCQINCVAVSMFYILFLWGWRVRVKSRIPRNDFFFLKRLEFPEATKIIAFSRNAQTKADHEDVGIHVQHVQIQPNTCIYKCSIYIEIYTYWSKSTFVSTYTYTS